MYSILIKKLKTQKIFKIPIKYTLCVIEFEF